METYTAVAEVEFYVDDEGATAKENILLTNVASFAEAMTQVEDYYGKELCSARITLVDSPYIHISEKYLDVFLRDELR